MERVLRDNAGNSRSLTSTEHGMCFGYNCPGYVDLARSVTYNKVRAMSVMIQSNKSSYRDPLDRGRLLSFDFCTVGIPTAGSCSHRYSLFRHALTLTLAARPSDFMPDSGPDCGKLVPRGINNEK